MQDATDFNRLFYFASGRRQRVLLNSLAYRRPLSSLPAHPQVAGVETQAELSQVVDALRETCTTLGYSLDDFVILESGRFHAGYLTEQAFPSLVGSAAIECRRCTPARWPMTPPPP